MCGIGLNLVKNETNRRPHFGPKNPINFELFERKKNGKKMRHFNHPDKGGDATMHVPKVVFATCNHLNENKKLF